MGVAQKRALDTNDFGQWPLFTSAGLSPNGQWAWYVTDFPKQSRQQVTLVSTRNRKAQHTFPLAAGTPAFTPTGAYLVFQQQVDSVAIVSASDGTSRWLSGSLTKLLTFVGQDWLVIKKGDSLRVEAVSGKSAMVFHASDAVEAPDQKRILVVAKDRRELRVIDLRSSKTMASISLPGKGTHFRFDQQGKHIAFLIQASEDEQARRAIWVADLYTAQCRPVYSPGTEEPIIITSIDRFSADGQRLFFQVEPIVAKKRMKIVDTVVSIASWADTLRLSEFSRSQLAVVSIAAGNMKVIQRPSEILLGGTDHPLADKMGLLGTPQYSEGTIRSIRLVSTVDGSESALHLPGTSAISECLLSPDGKYILYFDTHLQRFRYYDIRQRQTIIVLPNATSRLNFSCWINNAAAFVASDDQDVWRIDPLHPDGINLSAKFRTSAAQYFRLVNTGYSEYQAPKELLLSVIDRAAGRNGFCAVTPQGQRIHDLHLEDALFWTPDLTTSDGTQMAPVKARGASLYLMCRQRVDSFPQWVVWNGLSRYIPLTDLHPEQSVNWLSAHLLHYQQRNGYAGEAVLYLPENLDTTRRYPVIFHYYETFTNSLHAFVPPGAAWGGLNIPYLVSNGYIVCVPNITYELGYPGRSALDAVQSAADQLVSLSYIDSTRMGLQGQSFGGFETNYIVSHTTRFAAACSSAGVANVISAYARSDAGRSAMSYFEGRGGQGRMGASLWQHPERYIENSAYFRTDRVHTPMLIVANPLDGTVLPSQGKEWFVALRKYSVPAWLLQYNGYGHALDGQAAVDYTLKMKEFFDHFLKDAPLPQWMKPH